VRSLGSLGLSPSVWVSFWRVFRASCTTSVLFVWLLAALPARPYDADKLARPHNRELVTQLHTLLSTAGFALPRERIEQALIATTTPIVTARNRLFKPFARGLGMLGVRQSWGLFSGSGREAFRIRVEAQAADDTWRLVYSAHQEDALGLAATLSYRRLRGIYNPSVKGGAKAQYEGFVSWLAQRIVRDHPEYRRVRVSMERLRLGSRKQASRALAIEHESERAVGSASGRGV